MDYKIGDKIVYPLYGAGVIAEITEREFLGEVKTYYLLKLSYGKMEILVPVDTASALGVRNIIAREMVDKVLEILKSSCVEEEKKNWNKRYHGNMDKLRSGDILQAAEVYKILFQRNRVRLLSSGEMKLMNSAKQILFSELMLAGDWTVGETEGIVTEAIG